MTFQDSKFRVTAGRLLTAPEGAIGLRAGGEAFVFQDFADLFLVEPLRLNFFEFGIARANFTAGNANNNHASNSNALALGFNGCQKVAYLVERPVKIYDPSN
jgi:hypothetical protein